MENHRGATLVCDEISLHRQTLKYPLAGTFGRLDGNGHISTLLTEGPNPSSITKSIHPHVNNFLYQGYRTDFLC